MELALPACSHVQTDTLEGRARIIEPAMLISKTQSKPTGYTAAVQRLLSAPAYCQTLSKQMDSSFPEPNNRDSQDNGQRLPNNAYELTAGATARPPVSDTHGLQPQHDVASRRTRFLVDAPQRARQGATRGRRWFLLFCVLAGILIMIAPFLAGLLVQHLFYEASQTVWELRRVASELWMLFAVPGLLLALCGLAGLARKIPVVLFNLNDQTIRLSEKRFQTLPLIARWHRPGDEIVQVDELEALQIIQYKALHLKQGEQAVDQFELNLVLHDSSRRLVAKQPGYASLVEDATQMSLFLDVPFLDQSGQNMLY